MNVDSPDFRGSAAAQCGEALSQRRPFKEVKVAAPPCVEAQPRRWKSRWSLTVSQRLTAVCGGRAATSLYRINRTLATCVTLLTAHRSLLTILVLLAAFFLLPTASSQNETPSPQAQPSPSPAPSPSPSPTPPPNLHQWGAVTSFHGLPSDRTHAIAQTEFGVTWFATDGGLARFDGRRTSAVTADGLPTGRVLVLKTDDSGALWIGTDNGAARMWNGKFDLVKETSGVVINAMISIERDRVIMASDSGQI